MHSSIVVVKSSSFTLVVPLIHRIAIVSILIATLDSYMASLRASWRVNCVDLMNCATTTFG